MSHGIDPDLLDPELLAPMEAPASVPDRTPVLDGPGSWNPSALLSRLDEVLRRPDPDRPALVVATSGSTGRPKRTVISGGALRASGEATAAATGSTGAQWLLALPPHYVAGAQVLARSMLAGTVPVLADSLAPGVGFAAGDFLLRTEALHAGPRMTSLVPTQLHVLREAVESGEVPEDEALEALRSYRAILLGGAPASADLLRWCRDRRLPVVLTYGSAETAGGCVYDGRPLPGVRAAIVPEDDAEDPRAGRIWLGGLTLASGYLQDPARTAASFRRAPDGTAWYRTDDLGRAEPPTRDRQESGPDDARTSPSPEVLRVLGRADDVVLTGGLKVSARAVATALEEDPDVREAMAVGLPDPHWGQRVEAVVVPAPGARPGPAALRDRVGSALGRAAAPKRVVVLDRMPQTSTGKPDRRAVLALLSGTGRDAADE